MIPTPIQWADIALIKQAIASNPHFSWIKPSYICAEVEIESGWDPLAVNGTSHGLMQVEDETVPDVVAAYGLTGLGPQSDPYSSLLTGICYFDLAARKVIAGRAPQPLHLGEVAQAYQIGYEGFLRGERNDRYAAKMLAQQIIWAPLVDDAIPGVPVVVHPPPPPPSQPSPSPYIPAVTSDVVLDLSHHDGSPDFVALAAAGIVAVIMKATDGQDFIDPTFLPRVAEARNAGLLVGAYHFLDGSGVPGQVANFLTVAVSEGMVNWLALDWEPYPQKGTASVAQAASAAASVQAAMGRWPVLYTIRDMLSAPNNTLSNCPLWLAEYGTRPICPPGFPAWKLWQYEEAPPYDRSRFAGTLDELRTWWGAPATLSTSSWA